MVEVMKNFETLVNQLLAGYKTCCRVAMIQNGKACPICRTNLPYRTQARNLRPGDVVVVAWGPQQPYSHCTVKQLVFDGDVALKSVKLFRPYAHTTDFTTTGGVICYVGVEEFDVWPSAEVLVLQESMVVDVRLGEEDEGRLRRAGGKLERTGQEAIRYVWRS